MTEAGRVVPARLDEHQLALYELAVSWSECTAARFMLNHAQRLADESAASSAQHPSTTARARQAPGCWGTRDQENVNDVNM